MLSKNTKDQVREKFDHKCVKCGATYNLSVDHIMPKAEGGTDDLDNLQLLCKRCNAAKANIPPLIIRLYDLWTGYFYRLKNDIRGEMINRIRELNRLSEYQSLRDRLTNLKTELGATKAALVRTQEELLAERKLRQDITEKFEHLTKYLKVEWVEEKGFRKIYARKTKNPSTK